MNVREEVGQSTVELVAMLPIVAVIAMGSGQLLAAGAAREAAGSAAEAAAMAALQGHAPVAAARAAVPSWARDRLEVHITGRRVRVTVRPRSVLPGTADLLTARAGADAGPG